MLMSADLNEAMAAAKEKAAAALHGLKPQRRGPRQRPPAFRGLRNGGASFLHVRRVELHAARYAGYALHHHASPGFMPGLQGPSHFGVMTIAESFMPHWRARWS